MESAAQLIAAIAPITVLAAISPVIFLNASTVATNNGFGGGLRFALGNLVVLAALGTASMGLLGASAAGLAARELASRDVDLVLAVLLLAYGAYLANKARSAPHPSVAAELPAGDPVPTRGQFPFGVLSMATNFTTLPLYVSVAERLGAAGQPIVARVALLVAVTGVVLTPAWLPLALLRLSPDLVRVSPHRRAWVAAGTQIATIVACLIGGTFLLWHAV